VWLRIGILQSHLVAVAGQFGFRYHHAEGGKMCFHQQGEYDGAFALLWVASKLLLMLLLSHLSTLIDYAIMNYWLGKPKENKVPPYATHQVGTPHLNVITIDCFINI